MERRVESRSAEGYYASLEVVREPSDLTKTRKFKPPPDAPTTKYVRPDLDDQTVPFLKESAPYELLDLQEAAPPPEPELPILALEDIEIPDPADCTEPQPIESIAFESLVSDTIRTTSDVIVRFQRSSTELVRPRVPWLLVVPLLVAAVALGIGVAMLAF